jgi:carboxypeptidase Q
MLRLALMKIANTLPLMILIAAACVTASPNPESRSSVIEGAERLIAYELEQSGAWDIVAHLADQIGPRPSGSPNADEAVRWTTEMLESWGLDVRNEPVTVPRWVRGREEGWLSSHRDQQIVLTALGGSIPTDDEGLEAPIVEVRSFEEVDELGESLRGKIVLYNLAMDIDLVEQGQAFAAYSPVARLRGAGASRAARHGAVAMLIRSITSASLRSPHTGALRYTEDDPKIPAAAVTPEDADLIHRLLDRGETVTMKLVLTPRHMPDVESANVVAELRGRELPDEIVLIGGHLDSWDLGTGAIDNGAGVAGTMAALRAMVELGMRPRRTVRLVLFANEEMGLSGAKAYFASQEQHLDRHFATLESDSGATEPTGFATTLPADRIEELRPYFQPLERLGAANFTTARFVGADTSPLSAAGVPGFGLRPNSRHYFDYHHSAADTLDKIDPDELKQNAAAVAALTWILAEMPEETLRAAEE